MFSEIQINNNKIGIFYDNSLQMSRKMVTEWKNNIDTNERCLLPKKESRQETWQNNKFQQIFKIMEVTISK
jgi:hypothetical protein